jgi:hypothetical protein
MSVRPNRVAVLEFAGGLRGRDANRAPLPYKSRAFSHHQSLSMFVVLSHSVSHFWTLQYLIEFTLCLHRIVGQVSEKVYF